MRLRFEYAGVEGGPFEVPDDADVLAPPGLPEQDVDAVAASALAAPIGAVPLSELVAGRRRVLLIVDDATRRTPVGALLRHVAPALRAGGVEDGDVTVLVARGTHRAMTAEELARKLGAYAGRWRVVQHDWCDEGQLEDVGTTRAGLPVVVNRLLARSDVRIGIGQVGVHGIMGFSGGAKIVLPGVCGHDSEAWTHWRGSGMPIESTMGVADNPIRLAIEEGAGLAGLDAVVNVVLGPRGGVVAGAYGGFVAAQRACADAARRAFAAPLRSRADVAIVEAAPADLDYWQSIKGLYAASLAVKDGGVVVLAAPNPEGVAANHPDLTELTGLSLDELTGRVAAGRAPDVVSAAVAAYTLRARARFGILLVSRGVAPEDARRLGFEPFATVDDAVRAALARAPRDPHVAVLRRGGAILPVPPRGDGSAR